jgi:geranylgeranyl pyrophosphate synthase
MSCLRDPLRWPELFNFPQWQDFKASLQQDLQAFPPEHALVIAPLLTAGGQRIRPLLCFLCAQACGLKESKKEKLVFLAKAGEYLHLASLLHDDVMDQGCLRRNLPCAHRIWGNRRAILAGDFLLSQALEALITIHHSPVLSLFQKTMSAMTLGQMKEENIQWTSSVKNYLQVCRYKTAALFSTLCHSAGCLTDEYPATSHNLHHFGHFLGMAFQIMDDCWDVSPPKDWGKKPFQDFYDQKITFPTLMAWQRSSSTDQIALEHLFKAPCASGQEALMQILKKYNAIPDSLESAKRYGQKAFSCLTSLSPSKAVKNLKELTRLLLQYDY